MQAYTMDLAPNTALFRTDPAARLQGTSTSTRAPSWPLCARQSALVSKPRPHPRRRARTRHREGLHGKQASAFAPPACPSRARRSGTLHRDSAKTSSEELGPPSMVRERDVDALLESSASVLARGSKGCRQGPARQGVLRQLQLLAIPPAIRGLSADTIRPRGSADRHRGTSSTAAPAQRGGASPCTVQEPATTLPPSRPMSCSQHRRRLLLPEGTETDSSPPQDGLVEVPRRVGGADDCH